MIESGSTEEELIAKWMESHLGFFITTLLVNKNRREEGKERVSISTIVKVFYPLKLKMNIIKKIQSDGLNEQWVQASYNVSKQMHIMLVRLSDDEIMIDSGGKVSTTINLLSTK